MRHRRNTAAASREEIRSPTRVSSRPIRGKSGVSPCVPDRTVARARHMGDGRWATGDGRWATMCSVEASPIHEEHCRPQGGEDRWEWQREAPPIDRAEWYEDDRQYRA